MSDEDAEHDEQILHQFRAWLQQTRHEARDAGPRDANATPSDPPGPRFGLERLVEEFTALRHELKLQTRSARGLEELVEASVKTLADAATTFRSASAQALAAGTETADRNFASALAELDEALDRGREQWKKNSERLIGPSASPALASVRELYAGQSWWQRRRTAGYHHRVCAEIERSDEQVRRERQTLLTALLSGYELTQQRLARAMAAAGVMRIPTVGRLVDPEIMVVIDVVDVEGPAGQVVEEIRRGYSWKGGLLRPAEVRAIRPRFDRENAS
ncbi:MAG: nucleotide exchange factor GrpE [Gemmataceae bacterium]|nr:nucleotide exchange factor GrpE [Gemmataceae bacterium]